MSRRIPVLKMAIAAWLATFFWNSPLIAQDTFYKGKTVRIIVGSAPGGGFDTYARAIARHIGNHISGKPTVIVENMTGAGSLRAANHLYRVAKPDGLIMGHFLGGLLLGQAMGREGIELIPQESDP